MSSYMTAGEYLVNSHDKKLGKNIHNVFPILSNVLQNILDGKYQKQRGTHIHSIYLVDGSDPLLGNVVGISLGDGKEAKFLTDKQSVQDCITGVQGSIRILYESKGEIIGIELSTVARIVSEIIDLSLPEHLLHNNTNPSEIEPGIMLNPQKIIGDATVV